MNKKKWILAGILLLIGIPMTLIGYSMDKSGSTSTSMTLTLIGILLCVGGIGGPIMSILDSIRDWFNR